MRHGTHALHAVESCGGATDPVELWPAADQHGIDLPRASGSEPTHGVDQLDRTMPASKCPREDRDDLASAPIERDRPDDLRPELPGVCTPLELEHAVA